MANHNAASGNRVDPSETWPSRLNKVLIAIGVIAFGLIVTDRVIEAFRADDASLDVAGVPFDTAVEIRAVAQSADSELLPADDTTGTADDPAAQALTVATSADNAADDEDSRVRLQALFGSRVVFVSASEPVYVLTEDERRFDVGSTLDEGTVLAGVTAQELIFDRSGKPMAISLPDPTGQ